MTVTSQEQLINGVNVSRLRETVAAVRERPGLAEFRFRAVNHWQRGSHNRTEITGFYGTEQEHEHPKPYVVENDEPEVLLGDDQAPNPVEWLLHSLAGCVATTMACHAASRGICIESLETTLEGDIDVRGFLGLSNDVPRGFRNIRVTVRVKSDAPAEKLAELAAYSPVVNTITHATPVEIHVEKAG